MWDTFILNPMINGLLFFYDVLGNNFFLSIAAVTILIRLITLPLNMRQQRSAIKMQAYQPEIQAIQKKYKDNPQKMQEEFAKIGYNPAESLLGCLPLVIQMPVLIGLYRAILVVLGSTPMSLFELTGRVYDFVDLSALLPIANRFGWLNLAQPDPIFVLPIIVFGSTFLSQKLLAPKKEKGDDKKKKKEEDNPMASMTQSMQITMPVMFGMMALSFPSGLSLYFILSNLIGAAQTWFIRQNMPKAEARPVGRQPIAPPEEPPQKNGGPSANGKKPRSVGPRSAKMKSKRKKRSGRK